jgi:hypothetical protein
LLTGEAGYAKGNRLWSLEASRSMPRRRLLGNLFLSMATKAVSGYWNVLDPTNGFTAIRADLLRRLDWSHVHDGYFFETSMLVELHLLRTPVRDVLMPARYGDGLLRPARRGGFSTASRGLVRRLSGVPAPGFPADLGGLGRS